jgi:hypothetical protein
MKTIGILLRFVFCVVKVTRLQGPKYAHRPILVIVEDVKNAK